MAAHIHHIEDMDPVESDQMLKLLFDHASQSKYVYSLTWDNPGDLVIWDNTSVMHRSTPGEFEGKAKRDLRRTTVHCASQDAWGIGMTGSTWRAGLP